MDRREILDSLRLYDPNFDEAKVTKAIDFAIKYHSNQSRESGEPYYFHALCVAEIVLQMHLDTSSVITALLHDTIEDTDLTLDEIEKHFGSEIAKLVSGVTKLTKIEFISDNVRQAENFRKLLLAMSEDIRVLLVKLADRLHNMRTIDFIKSNDKRVRIALETAEIYAPLAERIGIQKIKVELQDICFRILHPEIRQSIVSRLESIANEENYLLNNIVAEIEKKLTENDISNAKVYGRRKTPYSVWMKMKQKNVGLDQLSDIIAFRIIVDTVPECYHVLGIMHTIYQMIPDSFQDFISTPKNNGYQSLHTVVIGPFKQKIEIQIRTQGMHDVAELGVAAHWKYKQKYDEISEGKHYRWIQELLSILEQASDPEDFLQNTKLAMYYDQVFCFTPKGNLIALPKGATAIDFAYAVHSNIGHHCVGAKVNGRIVPLKTVLNNGDQVEIVVSRNQTPSPSWQKFVVTGKARSEIRKFIYSKQKEQYIKLGSAIIENALAAKNISDIPKALRTACTLFKKKTLEDLFFAIGEGAITREEVLKQLKAKDPKISLKLPIIQTKNNIQQVSKGVNHNNAVPIKGLISGMAIHFAGCCHPIPGDHIVGVIHTGSGVTVHTEDCEMLTNFASMPDSVIDLTWDKDKSNTVFVCRLKIVLNNEPGSFASIGAEIAKKHINIRNFKMLNRNIEFFEVLIDLDVFNVEQIEDIISSLSANNCIRYIERFKA